MYKYGTPETLIKDLTLSGTLYTFAQGPNLASSFHSLPKTKLPFTKSSHQGLTDHKIIVHTKWRNREIPNKLLFKIIPKPPHIICFELVQIPVGQIFLECWEAWLFWKRFAQNLLQIQTLGEKRPVYPQATSYLVPHQNPWKRLLIFCGRQRDWINQTCTDSLKC